MTAQDIENAVKAELRRIAPDIDPAEVVPDRSLREQYDLDSIDFLNLMAAVGKRFDLPMPEEDYPRLATISAIVAYIAEKTGQPK
ncbi:acyl carrier protein [Ciceribacter thiooxidans]|uniref:Acyl carrier protein n=1 Tax=Ciceribacter thiooxidans TaxID=1969821 RepID=A0ABV7I5W2_9HYPH|nr:acyl carrier protein [Ciceribacter thiooxidans]